MTIQEILKKQHELVNRLPSSFQKMMEISSKMDKSFYQKLISIESTIEKSPLQKMIEIGAALKKSPFQKMMEVDSRMESYSKALMLIENSSRHRKPRYALDTFAHIQNFMSRKFDFEDYFTEQTEKEESPIVLIDESKRIKKIITDIYHDNSLIVKIQPREFEEIIAEMLYFQGFKVELTKQTRDNGYDIIALKYLDGHVPFKFLVECKRYTNKKVGVEVIRGFKEVMVTEKANRGLLVTTSYFTEGANKKQRETPYLLEFKDKDKVIEWVEDYWNQNC